jgi:hypothetical protein
MNINELVKFNNQTITLEELTEIEKNEFVESVQDNGLSEHPSHSHQNWYTVYLKVFFINNNCNDCNEIQVYTK